MAYVTAHTIPHPNFIQLSNPFFLIRKGIKVPVSVNADVLMRGVQ
jgi:hypothetical protein